MPEERALIQFRCVTPKHLDAKAGNSDTLTVYEGKWAYCPMDVRAKDHTWVSTGGISVNDVRMLIDRERQSRSKAAPD